MADLDLARYRADLRRFVLRAIGNVDLVDDIVQETMLRAIKAQGGFAGRAAVGTWLSSIAMNVLRDHFRRPATRGEVAADQATLAETPDEDGDDALMTVMKVEMGNCITAHLMALPDRLREVLVLHDMGGANHREVAATLAISEGNARVLLHRARAALRERLESHCQLDIGRETVPCAPRDRGAS